jgi:hypothetical protein
MTRIQLIQEVRPTVMLRHEVADVDLHQAFFG